MLFSTLAILICIPTTVHKGSLSHTSWQTLVISCVFDFSHFDRYKRSHCAFLKKFIHSFTHSEDEVQRQRGRERERKRETQADSTLSMEHDLELDLMTEIMT